MITFENLKEFVFSLPETDEHPHFEKTAFRVKKKIFVTYDPKNQLACFMLTPLQQSLFMYDPQVVYPVPNKWGLNGATYTDMKKVKKAVFKDLLKTAYSNKAPGKLREQAKIKKP
jgi:hypothetical protein